MYSIDDFTRPKEYLSPLDEYLGKIVRKWADEEVIPYRRQYDEDWKEHRLIEPAFDKLMGKLGIQRVLFPEDLGGWGLGHSNYIGSASFRLFEEVARADSAMAVALGVIYWPLLMICNEPHVNRRLCEEFAPMFCKTEKAVFAANAMTEPQGGADIENLDVVKGSTIKTTAVLEGDEWVINGHKLWPTNSGGVAKLFGVVCTTNPGSTDPRDFAFIYVPADLPGVTQGGPYQKAGMAADKNGDIWFENVRVPAYYRACGPGDDNKYFREVVSFGNLGSIAFVCGAMLNCFEILQDFMDRRYYRGRPLKEHDAVAGVLADIVKDIDIIRVIGYQYARMIDRPDSYGVPWEEEIVAKGRAYKYFACDRAVEDLGKAMNLMETFGSDRDWDIEKHWRDLKIVQLWMGGKQLCQVETARLFFGCETL
ncbi:MAG: acyl-CoA/acyl-ACP dehydrogenase [Firmicutes bacterium]|jgi:alkylation response protein AidB-like acyl-CoA dehydrogenase|nr:acyl-CoA/acyl-ACP dehydrogenase [Bacillota bacterium]